MNRTEQTTIMPPRKPVMTAPSGVISPVPARDSHETGEESVAGHPDIGLARLCSDGNDGTNGTGSSGQPGGDSNDRVMEVGSEVQSRR